MNGDGPEDMYDTTNYNDVVSCQQGGESLKDSQKASGPQETHHFGVEKMMVQQRISGTSWSFPADDVIIPIGVVT